MTTLNSSEITLWSESVDRGGPSAFVSVSLYICTVFPYIFLLLVDCFEWALIYVIGTPKISLSALAVSDWGGPSAFGIYILIYTGIFL